MPMIARLRIARAVNLPKRLPSQSNPRLNPRANRVPTPRMPGLGSASCFGLRISAASAGDSVSDTNAEVAVADTIVSANCW